MKTLGTGVMAPKTPMLSKMQCFYCGQHFSLRDGAELRNLKPSQVVRYHNPDRFVCHEHVSKNSNGLI